MTDLVLTPVTTNYNVSNINANFDKIEATINEDTLRVANGGNVMKQDFDLNGYRLLNYRLGALNAPILPDDAARLIDINNEAAIRAQTDAALLTAITNIQISQTSGIIGYATLAALNADLNKVDGVVAIVTNDPTTANNTTYRKVGASGTGSWVQAVDRVTAVQNNLTTYSNVISSSAGSASVGFLQAGTGATVRTVQDKLRERVSIKDFGAVGDYTTDDTAAIQAAINYCLTKGSTELHFPAGNYRVTNALTVTFTGMETLNFTGAGTEATLVIIDYTAHNGFVCSGPSGNWWVNNNPHYAISFSNFSLVATRNNVGTGISMNMGSIVGRPAPLQYFNNFQIRSLSSGQFSTGIDLYNTANVAFTGCRFIGSNGSTSGIHVRIRGDLGKEPSGWHFTDCEFIYGGSCIFHTDYCEGIYVTSCGFINALEGIRGQANAESGLIVTNSEFDCNNYGIVISGIFDVTLTGNCFLANGSNPASVGIWIDRGNGFSVSGNKISDYKIGVNLSNNDGGLGRAGYVGSNSINGATTAAVVLNSVNNILVADFASANVGARVVNTTPGSNVRVTAP